MLLFLGHRFTAPLHPCNNLHGIGRLKDRLRNAIQNGKKTGNAFHTTIAWCIIIFIQITLIPLDVWMKIEKHICINAFTRATPGCCKLNDHDGIMRVGGIFLDHTFEKLLVREGCHLSRVGHVWIVYRSNRIQR